MGAQTAKQLNLADLPKHVQNLKAILDVYLDPKSAKRFFQANHLIFHVTGIGYDGESQILFMNKNGIIRRLYIGMANNWHQVTSLPAETGKVLHMLKLMGYQLPGQGNRQAHLYHTYIQSVHQNFNHL
jgi:hypothetical protein